MTTNARCFAASATEGRARDKRMKVLSDAKLKRVCVIVDRQAMLMMMGNDFISEDALWRDLKRKEAYLDTLSRSSLSNRGKVWVDRARDQLHNAECFRNGEKWTYRSVWNEDRCRGCWRKVPLDLLQVDHIEPKIASGSEDVSNKQFLCSTCNRTKGIRSMNWLVLHNKSKGFWYCDCCDPPESVGSCETHAEWPFEQLEQMFQELDEVR